MQSLENLPAGSSNQEWVLHSALAATLDSLAAILSISNASMHFRALLPDSCSCCEKLLNFPHPLVKVNFRPIYAAEWLEKERPLNPNGLYRDKSYTGLTK